MEARANLVMAEALNGRSYYASSVPYYDAYVSFARRLGIDVPQALLDDIEGVRAKAEAEGDVSSGGEDDDDDDDHRGSTDEISSHSS